VFLFKIKKMVELIISAFPGHQFISLILFFLFLSSFALVCVSGTWPSGYNP
jgi:hypothetical protein